MNLDNPEFQIQYEGLIINPEGKRCIKVCICNLVCVIKKSCSAVVLCSMSTCCCFCLSCLIRHVVCCHMRVWANKANDNNRRVSFAFLTCKCNVVSSNVMSLRAPNLNFWGITKHNIASHASTTAVNQGDTLQTAANTNKSLENANQNIYWD